MGVLLPECSYLKTHHQAEAGGMVSMNSQWESLVSSSKKLFYKVTRTGESGDMGSCFAGPRGHDPRAEVVSVHSYQPQRNKRTKKNQEKQQCCLCEHPFIKPSRWTLRLRRLQKV